MHLEWSALKVAKRNGSTCLPSRAISTFIPWLHRAAAINFAEGLRGDLLIIHGTGETNTHLAIIEGLVDRLIELGKPFDYMAYPNRDHGLREGKGTEVHMRMLMTRYLLEHLPPGPR